MTLPHSQSQRSVVLGVLRRRAVQWLVVVGVLLGWRAGASAQPAARDQPPGKPVVLATVDGQPVYAGEVAALLVAIPRSDKLPPRQRARVEAQLLEQLIDRRLVVRYLRRHDQAISQHHIDAAIRDVRAKLAERKTTLAKHLARQGITEAALRADIAWRMNWQRYTQQRITDAVLEKYFDDHRADFDGRQVRVQHLLLQMQDSADPTARDQLATRAAGIRQQIVAGRLSFDDAVRQFSQGASKDKAGDLGFIAREGAMPEPFAAAAFRLKVGEISPPVPTTFGVHLIRCTEIKPGENGWKDVAGRLRSAVVQRGFRKIVETERPRVAVEFTGRGAYLDPETGQLVAPQVE